MYLQRFYTQRRNLQAFLQSCNGEGDRVIMTVEGETKGSTKVEQLIQVLSDIFGSREEVLITLLEVLESDSDITQEQKEEIFQEIKRLHEETGTAIAK
jgi:hypothetical protein